jgi:HEAT repeat protein
MSPAHRATLALFVGLTLGPNLFAHNGEPRLRPTPPSLPQPPPGQIVPIKPPRWSWVHWWEANRDRFLQPQNAQSARGPATGPVATTEQAPATQESDPIRIEATRMLLTIIDKSDNEDLVQEATLAIGKMQYKTAVPLLGALAQKSRSQKVRRAALVALGLIGGAEAEIQILAFNPVTTDDRLAAIAALGLLPEIQDATFQNLRNALSGLAPGTAVQNPDQLQGPMSKRAGKVADAQTAATICWALRQHHRPDNLGFYQNLLFRNESAWVASEAITALGQEPDATSALTKILLADPSAIRDIASWNLLDLINRQKLAAVGPRMARGTRQQQADAEYQQYLQRYKQYQSTNPNAPPPEKQRPLAARTPMLFGEEEIFMANLRSSAAVALGHVNRDEARDALLQFLEPNQNDYLFAPRGFAVMATTPYANDQTRDRLIFLLGKKDQQGKMVRDGPPEDPTRGFAALALGMYAAPYDTPSGPADRPGYDQALITLAERLDDQQDTMETRCACAVGLGLSRRTEVLPPLIKVMQKLNLRQRSPDELLFGFILLGRALAGDRNLIEPATGLLVRQGDETSMQGILARRASVLALGVMRSGAVVPILTQAWHLNYWVNHEVIVALKLVGATGSARPIMDRLRDSKDPREQAYMAKALGELLAKEQPTRLTRLMAETNFTVRNDPVEPIKELANEFLFGYLIPSFGEAFR